MMHHDSTSIISSLQMHYGDSDDDENDKRITSRGDLVKESSFVTSESDNPAPENVISASIDKYLHSSTFDREDTAVHINSEETDDLERETEYGNGELISDDEDGEHLHHQNHSQYDVDTTRKQTIIDVVRTESPSSQGSTNPGKKAARLVSYGPDEDVDEEGSSDMDEKDYFEDGTAVNSEINVDSTILSRSIQNMTSDEIKIPPEPAGKCPYQLQIGMWFNSYKESGSLWKKIEFFIHMEIDETKKIEDMYERMRREGLDLNRTIQSKKNFRNPSIYEKLIDYCHIDEKGTNFPPEIYDPHIWGKESLYDELDKVQRKDMERREKEKKTKIEFVTGTKKAATLADSGTGPSDEKKRKTKWDAQPAAVIQVSKLPSANQNPGVVNLTAVVTGTKATVIPAMGSLSKKPSSGK